MAKRAAPEVNAGSMADIAFLLLIFFLVTTTIETDSGISRKLPPIDDTQQEDVIIKEKNFPKNSKLLYKSASGCMEHINIFKVSNINTTLKYLKTKNFWICGFDKDGKKDFTEHNWKGNSVLLFGSEGYGLKYQTSKNSDFLFKIIINKKIESLNISNSASIVFHYINNLRKKE